MKKIPFASALCVTLAIALLDAVPVEAQLGRLRNAAKKAAEREVRAVGTSSCASANGPIISSPHAISGTG